MYIRITPAEGFTFANTMNVTINGETSLVDSYGTGGSGSYFYIYSIDFTVSEAPASEAPTSEPPATDAPTSEAPVTGAPVVIDTVEILNFVEPVWGAAPNYGVTVPEGARYSISYTDWNWEMDLDGDMLVDGDLFNNPDYGYFMFFVITPDAGCTFAENTVIKVNGNASYVGPNSIEADEIVFATIDFFVEDPASIVWGDANGDGEVTSEDAVLVTRHAMGVFTIEEPMVNYCDVNGDGLVDVVDAILVLRCALGLIDSLPV